MRPAFYIPKRIQASGIYDLIKAMVKVKSFKVPLPPWHGVNVIAIGPKGGKIVGYGAGGKAIYAGSQQAQHLVDLVAHKAQKTAAHVRTWLVDALKLPAIIPDDDQSTVVVTKATGAILEEHFGVKPSSTPGNIWKFKVHDLIPHVGKAMVPKDEEHLTWAAHHAAGGDEATDALPDLDKLKPIAAGKFVGSHGNLVFEDPEGRKWIFKKDNPTIARAEEAANRIARLLLGKDAVPPAKYVQVNGIDGVLVGEMPGETIQEGHHGTVDQWASKHFETLCQHQVVDWLIGNHDSHAGNFLTTDDGKIIAIDKGQAWKFFGKDELSGTYKPNNSPPVYNRMWQLFQKGQVKGDPVKAVQKVMERVQQMTPEQFKLIVAPYVATAAGHGGFDPATRANEMAERLQNLESDWGKFLAEMTGHKVTFQKPGADNFETMPEPEKKNITIGAKEVTKLPAHKVTVTTDLPEVQEPTVPPVAEHVTGWPATKGNVTIQHPGEPAGDQGWKGYPGKGFKAVVEYKGKPYLVEFEQDGDAFFVGVTYPNGTKKTFDSPNKASDSLYLYEKGLPLYMTATEKKQKGISYPASKAFGLKAFAEELASAASGGQKTPDQMDVKELEAKGLVQKDQKVWNQLAEGNATVGQENQPHGVAQVEAVGAPAPKKPKGPPTLSEEHVIEAHTEALDAKPVGTIAMLTIAEGQTFALKKQKSGLWTPENGPMAGVPLGASGVAGDAVGGSIAYSLPVVHAPVTPHPDFTITPSVGSIQESVQKVKEADKILSVGPAPSGMPKPGDVISVKKKGIQGTVQLTVGPDGKFEVAFVDSPGAPPDQTFNSLSAASDHVWVVQQGYADAATYKAEKKVSKIPSGGGWKFWGINPGKPAPVQTVTLPQAAKGKPFAVTTPSADNWQTMPDDVSLVTGLNLLPKGTKVKFEMLGDVVTAFKQNNGFWQVESSPKDVADVGHVMSGHDIAGIGEAIAFQKPATIPEEPAQALVVPTAAEMLAYPPFTTVEYTLPSSDTKWRLRKLEDGGWDLEKLVPFGVETIWKNWGHFPQVSDQHLKTFTSVKVTEGAGEIDYAHLAQLKETTETKASTKPPSLEGWDMVKTAPSIKTLYDDPVGTSYRYLTGAFVEFIATKTSGATWAVQKTSGVVEAPLHWGHTTLSEAMETTLDNGIYKKLATQGADNSITTIDTILASSGVTKDKHTIDAVLGELPNGTQIKVKVLNGKDVVFEKHPATGKWYDIDPEEEPVFMPQTSVANVLANHSEGDAQVEKPVVPPELKDDEPEENASSLIAWEPYTKTVGALNGLPEGTKIKAVHGGSNHILQKQANGSWYELEGATPGQFYASSDVVAAAYELYVEPLDGGAPVEPPIEQHEHVDVPLGDLHAIIGAQPDGAVIATAAGTVFKLQDGDWQKPSGDLVMISKIAKIIQSGPSAPFTIQKSINEYTKKWATMPPDGVEYKPGASSPSIEFWKNAPDGASVAFVDEDSVAVFVKDGPVFKHESGTEQPIDINEMQANMSNALSGGADVIVYPGATPGKGTPSPDSWETMPVVTAEKLKALGEGAKLKWTDNEDQEAIKQADGKWHLTLGTSKGLKLSDVAVANIEVAVEFQKPKAAASSEQPLTHELVQLDTFQKIKQVLDYLEALPGGTKVTLPGGAQSFQKKATGFWSHPELNGEFSSNYVASELATFKPADKFAVEKPAAPEKWAAIPKSTAVLLAMDIWTKIKTTDFDGTHVMVKNAKGQWEEIEGATKGHTFDSSGIASSSNTLEASNTKGAIQAKAPVVSTSTKIKTKLGPTIHIGTDHLPPPVAYQAAKGFEAAIEWDKLGSGGVGKMAGSKPTGWPAWVPPPGLLVEGEHEGKKFWLMVTTSGHYNDGSSVEKMSFTVFDEAGGMHAGTKSAPNQALKTAMKAAGLPGDAIAEAKSIFKLKEALWGPGESFVSVAKGDGVSAVPEASQALGGASPADLTPAQKTMQVKMTLPVHQAIKHHALSKLGGKKLTVKASNKPGHTNIILKTGGDSEADAAMLTAFAKDVGLAGSITNSGGKPQTSQWGGAFITVPSHMMEQEVGAVVDGLTAASHLKPDAPIKSKPKAPKVMDPEVEAKIAKAKQVAEWLADKPAVQDHEGLLVLAHLQDLFGMYASKDWEAQPPMWARRTPDGTAMLIGAPQAVELVKMLTDMKLMDLVTKHETPLGTFYEVTTAALAAAMPGQPAFTIKGPDGKSYPKGTTFKSKVVVQTVQEALAEEPGFHKFSPHKIDPSKQMIKLAGTGSTQQAQAKAIIEKYGLLNKAVIVGQSNTLIEIQKGELEKTAKTETEVTPDIPPDIPKQPKPFQTAGYPTFSAAMAGEKVPNDPQAELGSLKAKKLPAWGVPVLMGKPGILRDFQVQMRRVKTATGKVVYEAIGQLCEYDAAKGKLAHGSVGMPSAATKVISGTTSKTHNYDEDEGAVIEGGDNIIGLSGFKGTTMNGSTVEVCSGSPTFEGTFRVRIPEGADIQAELGSAFEAMGYDAADALAPADMETFKKWSVVRAMMGAKGWKAGLDKGGKVHDSKWLNTQLKDLGGAELIDSAEVHVTVQGRASVILDDAERFKAAGWKFAQREDRTLDSLFFQIQGGVGWTSTKHRFLNGAGTKGVSPDADIFNGGATGNFLRIVTGTAVSTGWHVIAHPRVFQRADWWRYPSDNYGNIAGQGQGHVGSGLSRSDVETGLSGGNEVMFDGGIGLQDMMAVTVNNESEKQQLLNKLKKVGITEVNGVPAQDFVLVGGKDILSRVHPSLKEGI